MNNEQTAESMLQWSGTDSEGRGVAMINGRTYEHEELRKLHAQLGDVLGISSTEEAVAPGSQVRSVDVLRAARAAFPGHEIGDASEFTVVEVAAIANRLAADAAPRIPRGQPVQLERWARAEPGTDLLLQRQADGYWTPWHIAQAALDAARGAAASFELFGYLVYETKFGGHWEFHEKDDLPAGDYLAHRSDHVPVYRQRAADAALEGAKREGTGVKQLSLGELWDCRTRAAQPGEYELAIQLLFARNNDLPLTEQERGDLEHFLARPEGEAPPPLPAEVRVLSFAGKFRAVLEIGTFTFHVGNVQDLEDDARWIAETLRRQLQACGVRASDGPDRLRDPQ